MPKYRKDNRMITIDGETKPLWAWSQDSGVSEELIRDRLKRHKPAEEAVFFQPRRYKKQTHGKAEAAEAVEGPDIQAGQVPRVQSE